MFLFFFSFGLVFFSLVIRVACMMLKVMGCCFPLRLALIYPFVDGLWSAGCVGVFVNCGELDGSTCLFVYLFIFRRVCVLAGSTSFSYTLIFAFSSLLSAQLNIHSRLTSLVQYVLLPFTFFFAFHYLHLFLYNQPSRFVGQTLRIFSFNSCV